MTNKIKLELIGPHGRARVTINGKAVDGVDSVAFNLTEGLANTVTLTMVADEFSAEQIYVGGDCVMITEPAKPETR